MGPALFVLGLAFWLRYESAQSRQFHADEGVQAYQAWRLIEKGEYRYDPSEHHGPSLYYVTKWLYPLLSDANGKLTDLRMRLVPMLFSLGTLVLAYVFFYRYGRGKALAWGLLYATAPVCVIYGAYYIQEALLGCFTLGFALLLYRYVDCPSRSRAIGLGILFGLMHVTKETSVLHLFAIGVGAFFCIASKSLKIRREYRMYLGDALWSFGTFGILYVLFFSSFFRNPDGLVDGFKTYFSYLERAGGVGHEKPWSYYLLLFRPHLQGGVRWGESAFGLIAIISLITSVLRRRNPLATYLSLSALALLIVYSTISYKTPWLIYSVYLLTLYPVVYTLELGFQSLQKKEGVLKWGYATFLGLLVVWWSANNFGNLKNAVFRFPSDERNPYLYVHTTSRYSKLLERLESVEESVPIEVYSPDAAWPLPWHLRDRDNVGYWASFESKKPDWSSIVVVDTRLLEGSEFLSSGGFWELHGLRPNTLLALRAPESVAEKWIKK